MQRLESDWQVSVKKLFAQFNKLSVELVKAVSSSDDDELRQLANDIEDLRCTLANKFSIRFGIDYMADECKDKGEG